MTNPRKVQPTRPMAVSQMTGDQPAQSGALPRALVVGLGNGGCQIVSALARQWKDAPRFALVNTDGRSLTKAPDIVSLQIGLQVIKGLGTGGEPRMGRRAAEADSAAIGALFQGVDLVFLIVCLGGGTGTGAAPLLVEAARAAGALTICFASLPFEFEGARRMEHAQRGIVALQAEADAVICLPNQRLLKMVNDRANVEEAFGQAAAMLAKSLQALWCVLSQRGVINLDLSDVRALARKGHGRCLLAWAEGSGTNKIAQVLEAVRQHDLLNQGAVLAEAEALLVSVMGGPDVSLKDVDQLMSGISKMSRAEALMMAGLCCASDWQDRLFVAFLVAEKKGAHEIIVPGLKGIAQTKKDLGGAVAPGKPRQGELFADFGRSRFNEVEATIVHGENLDIPTFKRRGILIQKAARPNGG
ncbi:MAG: hypothetical protein HYV35_04915 [Lentisphaerae bacterium]|nr:hypothetical protein [Lentisphaerota bacterium]